MAPILFPMVPRPKVARNLRLDRGEWGEALLTTLFSVDGGKCVKPTELLSDIVDPVKLPSQAKVIAPCILSRFSTNPHLNFPDHLNLMQVLRPAMVNPSPLTVAPLRSSFSCLNIRSSPHRTTAVPLGPCRAKIGNKNSYSPSKAPSASPMSLQSTLPSTLRYSHLSVSCLTMAHLFAQRKLAPQQRLASLGKTYELMKLLNGILEDRAMDPKVKLNHLRQVLMGEKSPHSLFHWIEIDKAYL